MKRLICVALAAVVPALAQAQEATLRVVSAFAENTTYVKNQEGMINALNSSGKGTLQLNFIGGPKAMPPFAYAQPRIVMRSRGATAACGTGRPRSGTSILRPLLPSSLPW